MSAPPSLLFVDSNLAVLTALRDAFQPVPEALNSVDFRNEPLDRVQPRTPFALAVPGTCFGLLDDGFAWAVLKQYGASLATELQQDIADRWCGQQPVGTAHWLLRGVPHTPPVLHAPLLRVPEPRALDHTDAVYCAVSAVLREWEHRPSSVPRGATLLLPGFGTSGAGTPAALIPLDEAVRQTVLAYTHHVRRDRVTSMDWMHARSVNSQVCARRHASDLVGESFGRWLSTGSNGVIASAGAAAALIGVAALGAAAW